MPGRSSTDIPSGIHPRFSQYYIRRVRADKKDPLTEFLLKQSIPVENDLFRPDSTAIFSFPQKSPDCATTREHVGSAIEQLELWLKYQTYWCEHKPSITVYVRENEWMETGAWVWQHFDQVIPLGLQTEDLRGFVSAL